MIDSSARERDQPDIAITENGPYEVVGEVPITPKRVVASEHGEPLTWATDDPLPHDGPTRLCRCGQSQTKPFCDETHLTIDFDGTETASTEPYWERHKTYGGPGLTVHRVGELCAHASFCANRITDWYRMLPDTSNTNVRTEVIGMVEHCPSGALVYEIDGSIIEPDLSPAVSPVRDGPLWVTGSLTVAGSDGTLLETRNRLALCRCGQSKNKPFCDGTHFEIGFQARDAAGSEARIDEIASPWPYQRIVVGAGSDVSDAIYGVAAMVAGPTSEQISVVESDSDKTGADDVLEVAVETDAGLIVVCRGGDRLSKPARRVLHNAPCDVLVIADRDVEQLTEYRRVLVASDGSATADRAARRGFDLARALGATVDLVFVGHPATGELIVSDTISVSGAGVQTETHLLAGNPAEQILQAADDFDADLIVVGNKGIGRSGVLHRESVPGAVLTGSRVDVLLARTVHQRESELEPGDGGVIEKNGEQVAAFVDDRGGLHLMSARCPHLGCIVAWNPTDKTFDCPCHGSRFGPTGELVDGPAPKGLRPF